MRRENRTRRKRVCWCGKCYQSFFNLPPRSSIFEKEKKCIFTTVLIFFYEPRYIYKMFSYSVYIYICLIRTRVYIFIFTHTHTQAWHTLFHTPPLLPSPINISNITTIPFNFTIFKFSTYYFVNSIFTHATTTTSTI